ncbi:hypothetical protein GCM10027416_05760 [Okibacterium endophyticum]
MSRTPSVPPARRDAIETFLASAQVAQALTLCILGTGFLSPLLKRIVGWPGLIAILATLVVASVAVLIARRRYLDWHGLLPLSIIAFVAWCGISVLWSDYEWLTIQASLYQVAFAFLGLTVALTRDLIQIVRSVGKVLRVVLTASLVVEILSGILLDIPFRFIGVSGSLADGGPIQGLFGTRNLLGMVTLIALVTFVIEWRMRSVPTSLSAYSIALAAACVLFSQSPVTLLVIIVLAIATVSLFALRKAKPDTRRMLQAGLLLVSCLGVIIAYLARTRIIDLLNAGSEFEVRYRTWIGMWRFIQFNPLEGWGWSGYWSGVVSPFSIVNWTSGRSTNTGLNSYLDVYLQVGLVGFFLFLVLCGFAFLRSWLLASNRRSVTYTWPALVLVAILATAVAESFALVESGWLLLVICAVKASEGLSWRSRLPEKRREPVPVPQED